MAREVVVNPDALGGSFEPAPVGTKVIATVFDIEETVTGPNAKNAGKPQAVVTVKIQSDFKWLGSDGKPQSLKGREIRYNNVPLYGDGDNAWVLATFAEAVGWPVAENGAISIPDTHELGPLTNGKEIVVQLGVRAKQDDPSTKYNTVNRWFGPGAATTKSPLGDGGGAPGGGAGDANPWN